MNERRGMRLDTTHRTFGPLHAHDVTLCFKLFFGGCSFWSTLYNNVYLYVGMEKL